MEIFGYLVLVAMNVGMTLFSLAWLLLGGFEIGNVFTSTNKIDKYLWIAFASLNIYFWSNLINSSPFSITVS
jgi:hypothetical protein